MHYWIVIFSCLALSVSADSTGCETETLQFLQCISDEKTAAKLDGITDAITKYEEGAGAVKTCLIEASCNVPEELNCHGQQCIAQSHPVRTRRNGRRGMTPEIRKMLKEMTNSQKKCVREEFIDHIKQKMQLCPEPVPDFVFNAMKEFDHDVSMKKTRFLKIDKRQLRAACPAARQCLRGIHLKGLRSYSNPEFKICDAYTTCINQVGTCREQILNAQNAICNCESAARARRPTRDVDSRLVNGQNNRNSPRAPVVRKVSQIMQTCEVDVGSIFTNPDTGRRSAHKVMRHYQSNMQKMSMCQCLAPL